MAYIEKMRYILAMLLLILLVACPKPDEDVPITETNPQVNIPWPSLGDTPWPMHHHDPQSTGRSQYAGPVEGIIHEKVRSGTCWIGISIDHNNNFFAGHDVPEDELFYSWDSEGNPNWLLPFGVNSTPLVRADNVIYLAGYNQLLAVTQTGDTDWSAPIAYQTGHSLNLDMDGNIYFFAKDTSLYMHDINGALVWQLFDERFHSWGGGNAPVFSPDGNTLYKNGEEVSVVAVDIQAREIKWDFGVDCLNSAPAIDNAGNLYFIPGKFNSTETRRAYSINPNGDANWIFEFESDAAWSNAEMTIDYNGNIYFATDTLYSLTTNGTLRWKLGFDEGFRSTSALVCDINNNIYIGAVNGDNTEIHFMSVNDSGELLWVAREDVGFAGLGKSPAISADGSLYYPMWGTYPFGVRIIK